MREEKVRHQVRGCKVAACIGDLYAVDGAVPSPFTIVFWHKYINFHYSLLLLARRVGACKITMANAIKLSDVRKAINAKKGTISQIVKGMYAFDDCKELKELLPKKDELLSITATICKEMGVGEEYKVTVKGEEKTRVRKASFDLVLRYLVKHQNDLSEIVAARKKEIEAEKAAKSVEKKAA